MSWSSFVTESLPHAFHLEHQVERGLVLDGSLLIGKPKILPDQAHVEASGLYDFSCCKERGHGVKNIRAFKVS